MKRPLLLTGGRGFVAGSVLKQAVSAWDVHVVSRGPAPSDAAGCTWHTLEPSDGESLERLFREVHPYAVIHTAAIADIDYCEAHRDETERVNVGFTRSLAEVCRVSGARLVYLSTDNAFDGIQGFYSETTPPNPVNFYGQTKVAGERVVAERLDGAVIARVAIVMGLGAGNSFLSRMVPALESGRELGVPPDEVRSPIDVATLGQALLELAGNEFVGVIHLAGNDVLSRLDMARRIAAHLGYDPGPVVANDPSGLSGRARRPRDVSLDNALARKILKTALCGLEEGLDRALCLVRGNLSA